MQQVRPLRGPEVSEQDVADMKAQQDRELNERRKEAGKPPLQRVNPALQRQREEAEFLQKYVPKPKPKEETQAQAPAQPQAQVQKAKVERVLPGKENAERPKRLHYEA